MSFFNFSNKTASSSSKKPSSSSKEPKILPKDYQPKRFGLKYDPPSIILEYMLQDNGKLYHHKMKLHGFKESSNSYEFLEILKKKHAPYLANERVTDDQLISLLEKLKSGPPKKPLKEISKPQPQAQAQTSKLGKLEPLASLNNKPTLPKTSPNDFWTKTSNTTNTNKAMASDDLYAEDYDDDFDGDKDEDLNKLDTETLKQKKAKMDVLFSKNQKKPGDQDFKYDVQEDFNPKFSNEWDLDDDEDIV